MRAKAEIESDESHDKIVVTEIPYGVKRNVMEVPMAQRATEVLRTDS